MSIRRIILVAAALTVVLVATMFLAGPTPPSGAETGPVGQAPIPPEAAAAVAHLANHLGVDPGEITVDSIRAETWSDASLGLPEPGMMYAEVITEGHVVSLSHGGKSYVYHVAGDAAKLAP